MGAATVRGVVFLHTRKYLLQRFGPSALDDLLAIVRNGGAGTCLSEAVLPISEIPAGEYRRVFEAVRIVWGVEHPLIVQEIAESLARANVGKFFGVILKMKSPAYALKKSPAFWRSYYSTGELLVEHHASTSAAVQLKDGREYGSVVCEALPGFYRAALQLTGARSASVHHAACVHRGSDHCLFDVSWR